MNATPTRSQLPPVNCAIALGANLGNPLETLNAAIEVLTQHPEIELTARSSWYQTVAVTMPGSSPQPDYINGCALLTTVLQPQELLTLLLEIEAKFGRVRGDRWAARTLDLDLLLYNSKILKTEALELPHPRMNERAFVLVPLAEIAPDWIDPISGRSIAQLCQKVDCSDVQLYQK